MVARLKVPATPALRTELWEGWVYITLNPEATPVIKAISAVKGRNSIIIAPHPRAKLTNKLICDLMREAIVKMGAPADLVYSRYEKQVYTIAPYYAAVEESHAG